MESRRTSEPPHHSRFTGRDHWCIFGYASTEGSSQRNFSSENRLGRFLVATFCGSETRYLGCYLLRGDLTRKPVRKQCSCGFCEFGPVRKPLEKGKRDVRNESSRKGAKGILQAI